MKRIIIVLAVILVLVTSCATRIPKTCPKCGSDSWEIVGETKSSYNVARGLIGNKAIGPIGLLAGKGYKEVVYYCSVCGFTGHYSR